MANEITDGWEYTPSSGGSSSSSGQQTNNPNSGWVFPGSGIVANGGAGTLSNGRKAMITIDGTAVPYPKRGLSISVATLVDSARNADGVVVGQVIGRNQYKLDSLEWPWLTASEWSSILQAFSGFYANVTFPDPVSGGMKTLKMYPGDRSGQPYWVGKDGIPTHYRDCKVNIIDVGEA